MIYELDRHVNSWGPPIPTEPVTLAMGPSNLLLTGSQAILMKSMGNILLTIPISIKIKEELLKHLDKKFCLSLNRNHLTKNV